MPKRVNPMKRQTVYLSQHTYILKGNVHDDMFYVERFKSRNAEFRARMRAEIERCSAENIIPSVEQDVFLKKLEAEIYMYQLQIEEEWRKQQKQNG